MPFRDSVGLEFSYLKLSWSWVYHLNWNQKRFSICNYLDVCILCYSPLNHFQTYHNHCWNEPISGRDILIWLILLSHHVILFFSIKLYDKPNRIWHQMTFIDLMLTLIDPKRNLDLNHEFSLNQFLISHCRRFDLLIHQLILYLWSYLKYWKPSSLFGLSVASVLLYSESKKCSCSSFGHPRHFYKTENAPGGRVLIHKSESNERHHDDDIEKMVVEEEHSHFIL